jgi:aspartate racemase
VCSSDLLDVNRGIELVRNDQRGLIAYLHASVNRLAQAGCDVAAMAANTPHIVFDELAALSPIPLLSIVETCAAETERLGLRRVGLLGTGFTMGASFYPQVFGRRGIDVRVPNAGRLVPEEAADTLANLILAFIGVRVGV